MTDKITGGSPIPPLPQDNKKPAQAEPPKTEQQIPPTNNQTSATPLSERSGSQKRF